MNQPFDVDLFKSRLSTAWLGREFIHIDEVDSTNAGIKKIPSTALVHGEVFHADYQTHGRGQYDRKWDSSPRKNLTFSIAFRPPKTERITLLTLACVHAVSGVLERYINESVQLKWPNDLIIDGKKVGGILTECIFLGNHPDRVLTGIGVNVFEENFTGNLENDAVSIVSLCRAEKSIRREVLLAECLEAIEQIYARWHNSDPELPKEISRKLIGYGNWVEMEMETKRLPGLYKFLGINSNGELVSLNEDLDVNTFTHEQIRIITGNEKIS
jgi:BirA family transcriptional regulator, biotin operon repressor / biotin---[acetyl-CoA-carboxylase] ligase